MSITPANLTPAQEKKLDRWLAKTGLQSMMLVNIMEGKWKSPIDKTKLWALYESEQQRHKEGWYASAEDVYGDLFREFEGLPPLVKPAPEERFKVATQLFLSDCRLAVSETMLLAREGYPPAMAKAAEIFYEGELLAERLDLALQYAERAKETGYTGGLALLALLYAEGCGRKKNPDLAAATIQAAIDSNDPENDRYIGINYITGEAFHGERNPVLAEEYLVKAVERKDWHSAVDHFYMVQHEAIPEPKHKPSDVFFKAVDVGYPPALHELGKFDLAHVAYNETMPDDEREGYIERAAGLILDAAKANFPPAMAMLNEDPELERFGGGSFKLSDYIQFDDEQPKKKTNNFALYPMDIKRHCYNRYFIEWIRTHCSQEDYLDIVFDYDTTDEESVTDTQEYVLEEGINGTVPACFDEFLGNKFRDREYIKTILTDDEYQEYLKVVE